MPPSPDDHLIELLLPLGADEDSFAVLVSQGDDTVKDPAGRTIHLNALGRGADKGNARILFMTHAQVMLRTRYTRSFEAVAALHYQGRPRDVRVWDESILPAQPLTVSRRLIGSLAFYLGRLARGLADDLEDLSPILRAKEHGELYALPDLGTKHDVSLNDALRVLPKDDETIQATTALWTLFGTVVTISKDGGNAGETVLDNADTIPDDLKPMLVLDASGRVRATYEQWKRGRGDICSLAVVTKDYAPLETYVWKRAGSQYAFDNPKVADEIVDGVAAEIITRPDQEWLVVHLKPRAGRRGFDLGSELRKRLPHLVLPDNKGKVKLLAIHFGDAPAPQLGNLSNPRSAQRHEPR
jgi:hypothetical protein